MVFQVSAIARTLSPAEEPTQAGHDGVGPLPRDAVRGAVDDLEGRVRRQRRRPPRLGHVLRVARAGDPERRERELVQARLGGGEGGGGPLAQLAGELAAVEVVFAPRHHVAAEQRLRVPVAHQRGPVFSFKSPRPLLSPFCRGADASRDEDRAFVLGAIEQRLQGQTAAHRISEEDVAAWLESRDDIVARVPEKVPVAARAEKAGQRDDYHSASYFAQARSLASASGISSVTRSSIPHIDAHCWK